jgi:hypothetical protein
VGVFSALLYGEALIRDSKPAEGIALLKVRLTFWDASGGKLRSPAAKALLAKGMALSGDLDSALRPIDEQIVQIERPGFEERLCYAEILRLKCWMPLLKGDVEGAERNFFASLDWARHQQAKSWELRTSTSLARRWQSQGKRKDAFELLARYIINSLKVLTPAIFWTQSLFSRNWGRGKPVTEHSRVRAFRPAEIVFLAQTARLCVSVPQRFLRVPSRPS